MKKLIPNIILITLFCVACSGTLNNTGKTLASTATSVDSAMKGWATYVVLNKPPIQQENEVRNVYSKYQSSMLIAKIAYAEAAAQPTNSAALDTAIKVLDASRLQLLFLIQTFTATSLTVTNN